MNLIASQSLALVLVVIVPVILTVFLGWLDSRV